MQFPRTYRALDAAPWCQGYMKARGWEGETCEIFVNPAWLPELMRGDTTAYGFTLAIALRDLRERFWSHLRKPEHEPM